MDINPLGRPTAYPADYDPSLLFPIARSEARTELGLRTALPFRGVDTWTAWEMTWLGERGMPRVATGRFRVPADSPNIIESKSLKLYLNSLSMSRYRDDNAVRGVITDDLSKVVGSDVSVELFGSDHWRRRAAGELPGRSLDRLDIECTAEEVDPDLLGTTAGEEVRRTLHTHLLHSNCPVTGQPDTGSLLIRYSGPRIDENGLLAYVVSYRRHSAFHEACVERIFVDILDRCAPSELTVVARYNRRGGLDINPFRTNFESEPEDLRLWRQ